MALKAGRVGVSPDQVDEFGKISSDATGAYTKQEADAKFETQLHASSTYETKTEASSALAEKQSINLSVPIELLSGSVLTVESALQGLAGEISGLCLRDTGVILSSTNDLNDIRTMGIYHIRGSKPNNSPGVSAGSYAILIVLVNTTQTDVRQVIIDNSSSLIIRTRTGSPPVWGSWYAFQKTAIE